MIPTLVMVDAQKRRFNVEATAGDPKAASAAISSVWPPASQNQEGVQPIRTGRCKGKLASEVENWREVENWL
jgi:hypothetical protein